MTACIPWEFHRDHHRDRDDQKKPRGKGGGPSGEKIDVVKKTITGITTKW